MKVWLLTIWLLGAASASQDSHPEIDGLVEAVDLANQGDRKAAVDRLDRLVRKHPKLVDARVLRGLNRHLLGDEDGAREDLEWAFSTARWEHVYVSEEKGQEVSKTVTTLNMEEQRVVGVATLALMDARAGRPDAARKVLARGVKVFGEQPRLKAAEARILASEGKTAAAWGVLQEALDVPDDTGLTATVASELAALDPGGAPPGLLDALAAAGQWTAVYNRARGLVAERRYTTCSDVVREGLRQFEQPKLLALGYTCAARSDPAQATVWLGALGGARKASPADVVAHARVLTQRDQHATAVELLQDLPRKLPDEIVSARHRLLLEALVHLGRLDEALQVSDGSAPAHDTRLAHALIQVERIDDARKVLERACPAMGDDPTRLTCDQLLDWVRAHR